MWLNYNEYFNKEVKSTLKEYSKNLYLIRGSKRWERCGPGGCDGLS